MVRISLKIQASVLALMLSSGVAVAADAGKTEKLTLACQVAKDYVGYVNAQDVKALRDLFAEGTDYVGPTGDALSDPEKIAAGYKRGFDNMHGGKTYPSTYQIDNLLPFGKNGCLLEFGAVDEKTGKIILMAVDRFEVNDKGKVTRFLPYFASSQLTKINAQIERIRATAAAEKAAAEKAPAKP